MSTWTSRAAVFALTLAAAGCVESGGAPVQRLAVQDGAVVVAGPAGYCIDRGGSRNSAESSFVLLLPCPTLSGAAGTRAPATAAVLTASILSGTLDDGQVAAVLPGLAAFFRSEPGRAALSRTGKADTVEVAEVAEREGVMYLRASDTSRPAGPRVEPEYWRAVLSIRGRLVTLSVLGMSDRPIGAREKRQLLAAFVQSLEAANPGQASGG